METVGTMIEAVLWDDDGVLVDTEMLFFETTRAAFARLGLELTQEIWGRHYLANRTFAVLQVPKSTRAVMALIVRVVSRDPVRVADGFFGALRVAPRRASATSFRGHQRAVLGEGEGWISASASPGH
jgi:hypothetical protein